LSAATVSFAIFECFIIYSIVFETATCEHGSAHKEKSSGYTSDIFKMHGEIGGRLALWYLQRRMEVSTYVFKTTLDKFNGVWKYQRTLD